MKYVKVIDDKWAACDMERMTAQMLDKSVLIQRLAEITSELKDLPTKTELDEAKEKLGLVGIMVDPEDYGHIGMLKEEKTEAEKHLAGMK